MRSRPDRSIEAPSRSKYRVRVPFSIQGHTMELYGPREVVIPHSRTIWSWSRRCHTFNSRRSLLELTCLWNIQIWKGWLAYLIPFLSLFFFFFSLWSKHFDSYLFMQWRLRWNRHPIILPSPLEDPSHLRGTKLHDTHPQNLHVRPQTCLRGWLVLSNLAQ